MPDGCTLLILAGGSSRRMGRDKATLPSGAGTLVDHLARRLRPAVDEILVAIGRQPSEVIALPQVIDQMPGLGPLGGMHAGLRAARFPLVWVVACDLPDVDPALGAVLSRALDGADAAVPWIDGEPQAVCAVYRAGLATTIEQLLEGGRRSIKSLLDAITVRYVDVDAVRAVDSQLRSFRNLNTPEDYEAWLRSR